MRELNVMEINEVAGAGFLSALTSSILLGVSGLCAGAIIGGEHGGDGGGILGVGSLGQLVGLIAGSVLGTIGGVVVGAAIGYNDPDTVTSIATQWANNVANGTFQATA